MKLTNTRIWVLILLISALWLLPACGGGGGGGDDDGSGTSNQVSLELGEPTTFKTVAVGTNGSVMTVNKPGDPIDGLVIDVPAGAYQEETGFIISYSPITSHSGDENLDPVTPLISIENGGEYADEIITVKIPVTIEDGYHYMAFYYDEATGGLEGIPEVEHDETSLTIATRHFSDILINRLIYNAFFGTATVPSGFQVKQDNWQFINLGTYLSPGGICSGMSIASLYYYNEKKKKQAYPLLYGLYDNGTSSLDLDDDQAIKLCSQAQVGEGSFDARSFRVWEEINKQKGDVWTYFMFIHAILLTEEPQYVSIFTPDGKSGHALVVYKKSGNDLYVADPNYPEDTTVKIGFDWNSDPSATDPSKLTGHFKPIKSQLNKDTDLINFTQVSYIGKTSVMDWSKLKDLWDELENKTMGKDFPDYDLKIIEKDASGTEREYLLTDGYETNNSVVKVKVETFQFVPKINVFYEHIGARDNHSEIVEVNLKSGDNELGFLIESEWLSNLLDHLGWGWTDFKYINIKLDKEDTPTEASISVTNTLDEDVSVDVDEEGGPWTEAMDVEPGGTFKQNYEPGTYTISVISEHITWNREVSLSAGQNYVYDFENSQDCNCGKLTVINETSHNVTLYYSEPHGHSVKIDANEEYTLYLNFNHQPNYKLDARANISDAPICVGDQCKYWLCWELETFTLDCQEVVWTISGSGTPCDYDPYL